MPACTSATRRAELGGLPPRQPRPIELEREDLGASLELERSLRAAPVKNKVAAAKLRERIARALSSGAALAAGLGQGEKELAELARRADLEDPRVAWLARSGRAWRRKEEKTLVFVAERETLELLRRELSERAQLKTGVFHEDLEKGRRDIEVAQFRLDSGPSILISTECGGEGRNFEFCDRLVLFDLPWSPALVEQRIGRLDRIGRDKPVEIVYFRPELGLGAAIAALYEKSGLFEEPLGGLERELRRVHDLIAELALEEGEAAPERLDAVIASAREAQAQVDDAAHAALHREEFRPDMAESILARVPEDLESLAEDVVLASAECLGLGYEEQRGRGTWSFELGTGALVESLPGVPQGFSYLGTFDRAAAVENEMIDFYASGHPFVEGVLAELEDSRRGRVALLHVAAEETGFGLVAFYRREVGFEAVAVDLAGRRRPEWEALASRRPLKSRRVDAEAWCSRPEWSETVQRLASHLPVDEEPEAVAALLVDGRRASGRR